MTEARVKRKGSSQVTCPHQNRLFVIHQAEVVFNNGCQFFGLVSHPALALPGQETEIFANLFRRRAGGFAQLYGGNEIFPSLVSIEQLLIVKG
ncbi:hypothetical protein SDC9_159926 [bioreactor metagenome]|uniref:Uncharacterized protein n=1 Tax=bioreactor metagenome TaxID=1076179 RepID=A0A645FDY0_9ZZZZ